MFLRRQAERLGNAVDHLRFQLGFVVAKAIQVVFGSLPMLAARLPFDGCRKLPVGKIDMGAYRFDEAAGVADEVFGVGPALGYGFFHSANLAN